MAKIKNVSRKKWKNMAWDDKIFDIVCNLILFLFVILVFYPLYFVVVASFSDPTFVNSGDMLWYPKGFSLRGYNLAVKEKELWIGYANTIIYTVGGTLLATVVVVMAGFAFSRKDMIGRNVLMKLFVFTMYFGGGFIPTYLVVKSLGLVGTRAVMIILGSVSVYNIIVVKAFLQSNIPEELYEASLMDGCGYPTFFVKVVVPLSKAVISVMVLYHAVGYWNSYFNAMVYLTDSNMYPLQLYLRKLLLMANAHASEAMNSTSRVQDPEYAREMFKLAQVMKYAVIIVSTGPIICVYPFIQKHFVKGVMIGSIKG